MIAVRCAQLKKASSRSRSTTLVWRCYLLGISGQTISDGNISSIALVGIVLEIDFTSALSYCIATKARHILLSCTLDRHIRVASLFDPDLSHKFTKTNILSE